MLTLARWKLVGARWLAELELAANGILASAAWLICAGAPEMKAPVWLPNVSEGRLASLCICAAIFIYLIRGGDLFVRGILEKAGGIPLAETPSSETETTFDHGKVIGQVERLVVVLIVMAGNLQALAFFFAAKGLIRSEELKQRAVADYFLLGSLSSFLIALAGGLILQQTLKALW